MPTYLISCIKRGVFSQICRRRTEHQSGNARTTCPEVQPHLGEVGVLHVRSREACARQHGVLEDRTLPEAGRTRRYRLIKERRLGATNEHRMQHAQVGPQRSEKRRVPKNQQHCTAVHPHSLLNLFSTTRHRSFRAGRSNQLPTEVFRGVSKRRTNRFRLKFLNLLPRRGLLRHQKGLRTTLPHALHHLHPSFLSPSCIKPSTARRPPPPYLHGGAIEGNSVHHRVGKVSSFPVGTLRPETQPHRKSKSAQTGPPRSMERDDKTGGLMGDRLNA